MLVGVSMVAVVMCMPTTSMVVNMWGGRGGRG